MIVYTLQSNASFGVLGNQVQAIRDYLAPEKIVVVQGPYGGVRMSEVRLTEASAEKLRVEILEVRGLTGTGFALQPHLFAWILTQEPGRDRIILQADTFPVRPLTVAELLDGHPAAGRGHLRDGKPYLHYTWLCVSKEWTGEFMPPYWDGPFRLWNATRDGLYENCEPGWWHADRINQWHLWNVTDKSEEVRKRYPTTLAAETEPAPAAAIGGSTVKQISTTGDHLHAIFRDGFKQDFTPSCSCRATMKQMNDNPPEWSEAKPNRKMIVAKIKAEMKNRGWWGKILFHVPGVSKPLNWIVLEAVRRARKDATCPPT